MCVSLWTWPSFRSERRFQQSIHELQPFFVDRAPFERVAGENSQTKIAAGSAEHHLDFLAKLLWNRAFFLEPFEQFEHVRRRRHKTGINLWLHRGHCPAKPIHNS